VNRVCLDTSAYSHFKRGDPSAIEAVSSARIVYMPVILLGELRTGFRLGGHPRRNEKELRRFLDHPVVSVLDVDDEAASHYARLMELLRTAGTPLPTNDVWIAALAAREGATVLTFDAHFEVVPGLGVHILPSPPA
jgi:tRNA(fMet)-specific endonuclease VapC